MSTVVLHTCNEEREAYLFADFHILNVLCKYGFPIILRYGKKFAIVPQELQHFPTGDLSVPVP